MLYETTTGARDLLPGTRRRNHPTSRPPIKTTSLEIELAKCTVPSYREERHLLRLPFVGEISSRFCSLFFFE